jgi:hypothetical protein
MFENRVLSRMSGSGTKKEVITERWRKLCNEELHNVYSSPNIMVKKLRRSEVGRHIKYQLKNIIGRDHLL